MPLFRKNKKDKEEGERKSIKWDSKVWYQKYLRISVEFVRMDLTRIKEKLRGAEEHLMEFGIYMDNSDILENTEKSLKELYTEFIAFLDFGSELYKKEKKRLNIPKLIKIFTEEVKKQYGTVRALNILGSLSWSLTDVSKKIENKLGCYPFSDDAFWKEYFKEILMSYFVLKMINGDMKRNEINIEKHRKILDSLYVRIYEKDKYIAFDQHLLALTPSLHVSPLMTIKNIEEYLMSSGKKEIFKEYIETLIELFRIEDYELLPFNRAYAYVLLGPAFLNKVYRSWDLYNIQNLGSFYYKIIDTFNGGEWLRNEEEIFRFEKSSIELLAKFSEIEERIIRTIDATEVLKDVLELFPYIVINDRDQPLGKVMYVEGKPSSEEIKEKYIELRKKVPKANVVFVDDGGVDYAYSLLRDRKEIKIESIY